MGQENIITQKGSEYNQTSFIGGMNMLLDDTRIANNQYVIGFDLTNRRDKLSPVFASVQDLNCPKGIIQEHTTFGLYEIVFVSGNAWYKYYTDQVWTPIPNFKMDGAAPRYWSCPIPISLTNTLRMASTTTITNGGGTGTYSSASAVINSLIVAGAAGGNLPGLLVQDNINQPQFIYLDPQSNLPIARTTQNFNQWAIGFTSNDNTIVGPAAGSEDETYDLREYVPIGNCMVWQNGILFIVSKDFSTIYRSVSGRPLDFMVNVTNLLTVAATNFTPAGTSAVLNAYWQFGGGDATTTNYSVGVGGISCIRAIATGGILVCASNANFSVTLNQTPNAPTIFGEYTFIRTFLFNATCMSDRAVLDTVGDTRFIELTGIRSFNAVQQEENEGRNDPFSKTVQTAFGSDDNPVLQSPSVSAAIFYNSYELYAVNTLFGYAIAKYDTVNNCWVSFDVQQTNGVGIKMLSKIELGILRCYAVTTDNKLYVIYSGPNTTTPYVRTLGICSTILWAGTPVKIAHPKLEVKMQKVRAVINSITKSADVIMNLFANNRQCVMGPLDKTVTYQPPTTSSTDKLKLPDVDTMLANVLFSTPDVEQAWKYFMTFSWTGGELIQFSTEMDEMTPMNPADSQNAIV
jgi:hypothetical protein